MISSAPARLLATVSAVVIAMLLAAAAAAQAAPTSPALIQTQPANAVGLLNSTVSLTVGLSPTASAAVARGDLSLHWMYWVDPGTKAEIVNPSSVRLTEAKHGKEFWAELRDGDRVLDQSLSRLFGVVSIPRVTGELPTATLRLSGTPMPVTVVAVGGYANVARPVAVFSEVAADGTTRVLTDPPVQSSRVEGGLMRTTATQTFTEAHAGRQYTVQWKTCLIAHGNPNPCPAEVPDASLTTSAMLPVAIAKAPVITSGMPGVTHVAEGDRVTLGVLVESELDVTYAWWRTDGDGGWRRIGGSSRLLQIDSADFGSHHNRHYRVDVESSAGKASASTRLFLSKRTFLSDDPPSGYAPVDLVNLLSGPEGDLGLTLVDSSYGKRVLQPGWEIPHGDIYLPSGTSLRAGWHWSFAALLQHYTMQIGRSTWVVTVQFRSFGVYCEFKDLATGSTDSPYRCANLKDGGPMIGRGTHDADSKLLLVHKAQREQAMSAEVASFFAPLVCGRPHVDCSFDGTRSPGMIQVGEVQRVGENCDVDGVAQIAIREVKVRREERVTWNSSVTNSIMFELQFGTPDSKKGLGSFGFAFYYKSEYRRDDGGSTGTAIEESTAARMSLMPGMIGYVAPYSETEVWNGTATIRLGNSTWHVEDAELNVPVATVKDSVVLGPTPALAYYLRKMDDKDRARYCDAPSAGQL